MDVTCHRCSTEYEFEEALVSLRGTTVKCTQCGHLFKVQKRDQPPPVPTGTHWSIRQTDGATKQLDHLSELPALIRQGAFGRDDELSRTGKLWRRLGEIEELEEHFSAADRRGPSRLPPGRELVTQTNSAGPAADEHAADARTSLGPGPSVRQATAQLSDEADQAAEPSAPVHADALANDAGAGRGPQAGARQAQRPGSARPGPARARRDSRPSWAGVEAVRQAGIQHESRRHAWARLLTSAAIVAGLALWMFSVPPSAAPKGHSQAEGSTDPRQRFVAAAEAALSQHRVEQLDVALVEYIKALAYQEHDALILSAISRVHALWAQLLLSDAELSKLGPTPLPVVQLDSLLRQSKAHAAQAEHYAELALQEDPHNAQAELAHVDALRLAEDLPGARAALERVPAKERGSAEALRVAALLSYAQGTGDTRAASELAAQAVALDPERLCTRLLWARLLFAQGDALEARAQLDRLSPEASEHPQVRQLRALLVNPAPAQQAAADAGAGAGANAPASTAEQEGYIERGRALLEAGQLGPAKRMFEHALALQPDNTAAHAGLGRVAIARNRPLQAIDQFVVAALAGDADALLALADTYRRLGRQREALTAYQSYLQQNPQGPQLDFAKAQLERLGEQVASVRKP